MKPIAAFVVFLLILDVVALAVSGRRRAVRRAVAERNRHRESEQRRARPRRQAAPGVERPAASGTAPSQPDLPVAEAAVAADETSAEPPAERVARELAEGGTPWTPVPVPPPTYTLKPAAPRPEPAPLDLPRATEAPAPEPEEPAPAPESAPAAEADRTFADDLDLDAVLARRRAVNG
jgi:hypothetical protein